MADLRATVNGIRFSNAVLPAAGPNVRSARMMLGAAAGGAGGVVSKTLSLRPARDPRPTIARTSNRGIMNCETWSESAMEEFIEELKVVKTDPQILEEHIPLVVSIGYTPQEVSRLGALIEREVHPDAFEFSTHYTGKSVQPLLDVAKALRDAVQCPIWMKVSPNFPDMRELAVAASALVDGFVAINSFGPVLDFDMETGAPLLGSGDGQGWLSGPPIMPIALRIVHQLAALQEKPVIGVGGISSGADALKFIMAGASLVQVCSAALNHGHMVYGKIAKEMEGWLDGHGYRSLDQIRGLYARKLLERKAFRELPVMAIDEEQCTGCSACVGRCIHGALSMRPAGPDGGGAISKKEKERADHPIARVNPELCIGCGFCRSFCAYGAMALREG